MRITVRIAVLLLIISSIQIYLVPDLHEAYAVSQEEESVYIKSGRDDSYANFLLRYGNEPRPGDNIVIEAWRNIKSGSGYKIIDIFEGSGIPVVETAEEGYVEWLVNVETAGLYNVKMLYFPISGRSSSIERSLKVNGRTPYFEAGSVLFSRIWADSGEGITKDNRDNDIKPQQLEKPGWAESFFYDGMRYYEDPLLVYLNKGENTIRLVSVKEPAVIQKIELLQYPHEMSYGEVLKEYGEKGYKPVSGTLVKVQGENTSLKSDPMLYPVYDRSTPATEPYGGSKIRLNIIGGINWDKPGQWIAWRVEIPESGLYKLCIKEKQNIAGGQRGLFVNRKLYIDGKVPFEEAGNLKFNYTDQWLNYFPGEGEPYLFYLEKGSHEIRLEVTLGSLAEIIRSVEDSIYQLNYVYRRILMVTGPVPDLYRDYKIDLQIPEIMEIIKEQADKINMLSQKLYGMTLQKGTQTAVLDRFSYQLREMYAKPYRIPAMMNEFKNNISALGTWILETGSQPLEIDYLAVASPDMEMPPADIGILSKFLYEIGYFFASFFEDYNNVGNVYDEDRSLVVWIETGRDQAQVLKNIIDDEFTPQTGIQVNLKIVQAQLLLSATIAGKGPDIALQVGQGDPVNYAMRNAVQDLSVFDDLPIVRERFQASAMAPFEFNGGVFALPEQQYFQVMFYRKDILDELGLPIPQTWDDVYGILPVLQKNGLNFGMDSNNSAMMTYGIFLYQNGGEFYSNNDEFSGFSSETAVRSFKNWTEFYQNYGLDLNYNFQNRFRSGEMPIAIDFYNMYNFLQVFAPEIRGMWGFAPVPGTADGSGNIDKSVVGYEICCMMMKNTRNKNAAWEFMKWWTSAAVQERYGKEMECLLGPSARYPTANMEALGKLPWPAKDYNNLMDQWKWVKPLPEVAGGYFTSRHLNNAFRKTVYESTDPRETLLDYVRVINNEIKTKRDEFGLDKD